MARFRSRSRGRKQRFRGRKKTSSKYITLPRGGVRL